MDYWIATTRTEELEINEGLSKRISVQRGISNTINVTSLGEYSKKIIEKTTIVNHPKSDNSKNWMVRSVLILRATYLEL